MAGYNKCHEQQGALLLCRDDICKEIEKLFEKQKSSGAVSALCGLRRLAFGSIADGVRLLYMTQPPAQSELEAMDLYSVSEIKKPKDGAMEIKFCDRQKALEALLGADDSLNDNGGMTFYKALENSAAALNSSAVITENQVVEENGV